MLKKSRFPYFVLIPMLLCLTIFVIIPIIGSFVIAFFDYNPLRQDGGNIFVGLANFRNLFSDELFLTSLKNTLFYVVVMVSINICFTLVIAQVLSSLRSNKWRSLFRTSFFLPCVAPLAAVSIVWTKSLFPTKGGLNLLLSVFGVAPINWLGNAETLMPAILIISLWADVGYNIVLFIAGIQGIPDDCYEAAEIDGAGPIRRFFQITLPLLARTTTFVIIMTLISQFQAFAQFAIIAADGGPGRAGYVLSTFIYNVGFKQKDMGYASAISVALFLIIMAVTIIQRRLNKVDWGY